MPDIAADSIAVITWEQDFGVTDLPSRVGWQFPVTHLGQELVDPEWPIHTFRLRDEDDLNRFAVPRLQVAEEAQLFEQVGRQVMGLVDDDER